MTMMGSRSGDEERVLCSARQSRTALSRSASNYVKSGIVGKEEEIYLGVTGTLAVVLG